MIKLYLGGIGSGKSISIIKEIADSEETFFTNFKTYGLKNCIRLKMNDIIAEDESEKKLKQRVNWKFWKEQVLSLNNFNLAIDELHNIMHARRAMSSFNVMLSKWIAQIRKICGSSESTHFYCISQELERIDVSVRDLANVIVYCEKKESDSKSMTQVRCNNRLINKMMPDIYVIRYYFIGSDCTRKYIMFRDYGEKSYDFRSYFSANEYFRYYDSYEIVDFGESEWL